MDIAFEWCYTAGDKKHLEIATVTKEYENDYLVHFLYGYKSIGEFIPKNEVLAIVDKENGKYFELDDWNGWFIVKNERFKHYVK